MKKCISMFIAVMMILSSLVVSVNAASEIKQSGAYKYRVVGKYAELYRCEADVVIADEFDPFLRPNQYTDYDQKSDVVSKAAELAGESADAEDYIRRVYEFVCSNITYDYDKAESVQSGYLPDPDSTLETKKGICFDYAALAAAMMRSQGIPCQVITGYVGAEELYHAWNRFYLKNKGWLTVEIQADGERWKRVDITAAAAGSSAEDLENDQQYTTRYIY